MFFLILRGQWWLFLGACVSLAIALLHVVVVLIGPDAYSFFGGLGLARQAESGSWLAAATFAVLLLTAEDETADGSHRARQNVIHEAGLFQGHIAFQRVVMLVQNGLEQFSNVAGLQYISFDGEQVEQTLWELQRALRREGLITAAQPSAAADAPQAARR